MLLMKKLLFFGTLIFGIISINAQSSSNAKALLDDISNAYKSKSTVYMKFESELYNSKTKTKDNFNGEVYIKGNSYNLSIPKLDVSQIYDGNKLHTVSKEQQEITVTKPKSESDMIFTPTKVFDMYKKGFNISFDKTQNNSKLTFIKLTPNTDSNIIHVLIGVDKSKKELVKIIELNKNNTTTSITVIKQLENIIIPKSLLNFDKRFYKDYYISEI